MSNKVNHIHLGQLIFGLLACIWRLSAMSAADPSAAVLLPSPSAFAADASGHVWRATASNHDIVVTQYDATGTAISQAVTVHAAGTEAVRTHHPQIAIDASGVLYLSWASDASAAVPPHVWFSRSFDGGHRFLPPERVDQRVISAQCVPEPHMTVAQAHISIAWALRCQPTTEHTVPMSPMFYANSTDAGAHFLEERLIEGADVVCAEMTMTSIPNGGVAVLWRQRFGEQEEDMAMAEFHASQPVQWVRASFAHTQPHACALQQPSLALGASFGYHFSYVAGTAHTPGLRLARMDGEAWVTSPAKKIGAQAALADAPALISQGERVWLAWRSVSAEGQHIDVMTSVDGGKTWDEPRRNMVSASPIHPPHWLWLKDKLYVIVEHQDRGFTLLEVAVH